MAELDITIFRPSVIFGPDDAFLNMFAKLIKLFPLLPLGGGAARFQPVYVGDVASAFVDCLSDRGDGRDRLTNCAGRRSTPCANWSSTPPDWLASRPGSSTSAPAAGPICRPV
jgi:nucleoside-diphosphate-sugar epimerase